MWSERSTAIWNVARVVMIIAAIFLAGYTAGESRGKLSVSLMDCNGMVWSTR